MKICKLPILILSIFFYAFSIWADQSPPDVINLSGNSSEEQKLLESVRENLNKQENYWRSKDFSKYTTEELFDFIPPGQPSISGILAHEELKKRPDEVRVMLEKILKQPGHTFDTLYQLPFLAGMVSTDYQVEVAKRCLFHEGMKQGDMSLRIQEDLEGYGIFNIIAKSKHDETAVLDRLIAEDRIKRGSKFEIKWRGLLSPRNRLKKEASLDSLNANADNSASKLSGGNKNRSSASKSNEVYTLIGICCILLVLCLLIWRRFRK